MQAKNALSNLPGPIAAYLAAEKAKDVDAESRCFTPDALVHDEGEDHRGLDAIRAWKKAAHAKFQYEVEPLKASASGNTVTLLVRLTGNFPGSPVELEYTFTLANDKIASLIIQ